MTLGWWAPAVETAVAKHAAIVGSASSHRLSLRARTRHLSGPNVPRLTGRSSGWVRLCSCEEPRGDRNHAGVGPPASADQDLVAVGGALEVVPEMVAELVTADVQRFGW